MDAQRKCAFPNEYIKELALPAFLVTHTKTWELKDMLDMRVQQLYYLQGCFKMLSYEFGHGYLRLTACVD